MRVRASHIDIMRHEDCDISASIVLDVTIKAGSAREESNLELLKLILSNPNNVWIYPAPSSEGDIEDMLEGKE